MSAPARLLGVDFGSVRVGLAISDAGRSIASPLATYRRRNREEDAVFFRRVIEDEEVAEIIVGLPLHLNGHEGQKALEARAFAKWLARTTERPVLMYDERFTTVEAENHLLAAGLTSKRRKERRDRVAAQVLLQTYLDAGCPGEVSAGPLDG